jgi:hypothetical protein
MDNLDGRTLKAYTPDEYGYFKGVPLCVFNEKSYNNKYYTKDSLLNSLTNPSHVFQLKLTHGNLYGEWGHPAKDSPIDRIATVDRDRQSHHFRSIYVNENESTENPILRCDLKPSGPKGKYLEESLLSPFENTSFSLRCLMNMKPSPDGESLICNVVDLITFDAVDMPGYMKASKWYAPSQESLTELHIHDLFDSTGNRVAMESYSDQDILDLFGVTNVNLGGVSLGTYLKGTTTYLDSKGNKRSMTQRLLDYSLVK